MFIEPYDILLHTTGAFYACFEITIHQLKKSKGKATVARSFSLTFIWIMLLCAIAIGLLCRTGFNAGNWPEVYRPLAGLSLLLMLLGMWIRLSAIRILKKAFSVNLHVGDEQKLITTGLYQHIRHPSYTGAYLSMLGFGLIFLNSYALIAFSVLPLIALLNRIHIEEKMLKHHFGEEWEAYCKTTKRLIPFIY